MFALILKDYNGKIYECKSNSIFKIWYLMGKFISMKYQIRLKDSRVRPTILKNNDSKITKPTIIN